MQPKGQSTWWGQEPQRIIVRMPNWLGDLVMATPVLHDLRERFPQAKIIPMCLENLAGLLVNDPNVTDIFAFKKPSGWIHHLHRSNILEPLRHEGFDLGVLLTNSLSSAWWFWRGHVRHRLGYTGHWRRMLLDKALPLPPGYETQHLVTTYKMLLAPLGIPLSTTGPRLYVGEEERRTAEKRLAEDGIEPGIILIGINPGAAYGSAKCWLPDRFQALTLRLLENPRHRVIFFGDPAGTPLVNDICANMPARVINMAGKTSIRELAAFIQCCHILITNDSGPMHMAAALGVPPLALFGSTSDVRTGPYSIGRVIHKHVECSPCYRRVCPIDFRCMKRIEVEEVYNNALEMIYTRETSVS